MTVEDINRRHFVGRVAGGLIGFGVGFGASFPVADGTRSLRGADFPKQKNLTNARAEFENHQLVLEFLDYEKKVKKRPPRMSEKAFKSFLESEKQLSEDASVTATACFKSLSSKRTKEKEIRNTLNVQLKDYDKSIKELEEQQKQHLESQDLTVGNWGICCVLSGVGALVGWFFGSTIDKNWELSDEKRAEQALIDSRK